MSFTQNYGGGTGSPAPHSGERLVLIALVGLIGLLVAGVGTVKLAAAFAGHGGVKIRAGAVAHGLIGWHNHVGDPRVAFAQPLRAALPGPLGMYLAVALVGTVVAAIVVLAGIIVARRPTTMARAKQQRRRRGLAPARKLVRAFPETTGRLVVGRPSAGGKPIALPAELSLGSLMAPRTGKSSSAVGHILDAPGPVLTTSSKDELVLATAVARERQTGHATLVYDPLGVCSWPETVRWNPVVGCEDAAVAMRRAEAFMAGLGAGVANATFWKAAGTMLLRCALHACALEGGDVGVLRAWVSDPSSGDLGDVLASSPSARAWRADAEMMIRQNGETLDSLALTTAVALDCLALPEVAEVCSPPPGASFDPGTWLGEGGTLHVVAPDAEAGSVAPLTAAFVDEVVIAARKAALATPAGRLEPGLRLVLDELPNICPLPRLVNYISDGGGRGIQICWYAQSRYQLVRRFGAEGARVLLDATSAMLYSGGLQDGELLRDLSAMLGHIDVRQRAWGGDRSGRPSWSDQLREVPVMEPADIFALPAFEALMLAGGVGGTVVRLQPWWERPDAVAIAAGRKEAMARTTGRVA